MVALSWLKKKNFSVGLFEEDPLWYYQDYIELVRMEMSYVDQMRRIYTLAKRIAKVVLPPVLAQRD